MNILDYLDWRGDLTFEENELNEVDSLIFSELAYVDMDGFVSDDGAQKMTIERLYQEYSKAGRSSLMPLNDPIPLLKKAAESRRFSNIVVGFYVNDIDHENHSQMSACTFFYAPGKAYVAYRGTDSTIVGWREDFNLSFMDETPGQRLAVDYLEKVAKSTNCTLIPGGHSKGGNFAIYAGACCDPSIRETRITRVYCNDGPGFRPDLLRGEGFAAIAPITVKLVPDSSPVGILLEDRKERRYIKSDAKAVGQHHPYSWSVIGTRFEDADDRSAFSVFIEDTLSKWLSEMQDDERQVLVDTFFDALNAAGIITLADLNENKLATYRALLKAITNIGSDKKNEMQASIQKLFVTGVDVMKTSAKRSIRQL